MRPKPRYQPGDKIGGRYQVHQALMGGMGEVYLCLDLETIQPFALKTFQQRFLTNPKLREAFENEVATWVALEKHPNIVRCFYMDTLDNQPFMFLEWIAGEEGRDPDLRGWLRRGPLDLRLALDFTIDICRGLIHADLKQPGIVSAI
jgi:serine/threonine protein kinase